MNHRRNASILALIFIASPGLAQQTPLANYVAMGGVRALWQGDLTAALRDALLHAPVEDRRALDGEQRGGRRLAASVVQRVLDAA